jgi:hypothetical protein
MLISKGEWNNNYICFDFGLNSMFQKSPEKFLLINTHLVPIKCIFSNII